MKYSIAVALSHNSKLLILDEATSGLDPVIRDDILEMFLDFIQDEEHSILVSSHITSDLEKIADYIVFIHEGKVLFSKPKDDLIEEYGIIKCNTKQFDEVNKNDIIRYRKQDYEWQVLVANRQKAEKDHPYKLVGIIMDAAVDPFHIAVQHIADAVDGMNCLINQNAAAFFVPSAFPVISFVIIRGRIQGSYCG